MATFPAINVTSGKWSRISLILRRTPAEWPWAVSITIASAPASSKACARSNVSLVTPTAAAQSNRCWSSTAALVALAGTTTLLTLATSPAWAWMDMFLWTTPSPPCNAIAIAIAPSVTVSIPALIIGMFNLMLSANFVLRSTSFGKTWLSAGIRRTSSNVKPFLTNLVSQFDMWLDTPFLNFD